MQRKFFYLTSFFAFVLIILFFHTTSAAAASYCVNASGTATKANSTVASATACTSAATTAAMSMATFSASTFSAGDTIYFTTSGGNFTSGMTLLSSGTAGNPITLQGIGDGTAGAYPIVAVTSGNSINLNSQSYVTMSGFDVEYAGSVSTNYAITLGLSGSMSNVNLSNITINGNGHGYGIDAFGNASNITYSNITISNTSLYTISFRGSANSAISLSNITASASAGRGMSILNVSGLTMTNVTSNATSSTFSSLGITGSGSGDLTLSNYHSTGSGGDGLNIAGSFGAITLTNPTITSVGSSGNGIWFNGITSATSITITSPTITTVGQNGLYIYNTTVTNSVSVTNPSISGATSYGVWLRNITSPSIQLLNGAVFSNTIDGFYVDNAPGTIIKGFAPSAMTNGGIHDNGWTGIKVFATTGTDDNMVIDHNWIYNNGTPDTNESQGDHDGIDIHNNCSNETISNNILVNNGNAGLALVLTSNGVVYNNIITNSGTNTYTNRGGFYNSGTGSWTLKNNILVNNYTNDYTVVTTSLPPVTVSNYNLFFHNRDSNTPFYSLDSTTSYTLAQWQALSGTPDLQSLLANPLFNNSSGSAPTDFQFNYLSPAIDAGTTTSNMTNTSTDFFGNPIYGAPDIGAYEYQPPHTMITDTIDIGAGARIYGDGKFRDLSTTSGSTAHLTITPQGGSFPTYGTTTTRPAWLDVTNISNWTTSRKTWTESNAQSSTMVTDHTIGDLDAGATYTISVTGNTTPHIFGINGTICPTSTTCQANSSGVIAFEYNGGYSTHTFDLQETAIGTSSQGTLSGGTSFVVPIVQPAVITPIVSTQTTSVETSSVIKYDFGTATLKNGSMGNAVKQLQLFLNNVEHLSLVVDGKFGPKTAAIVKQWQKAHGLKVDGIVGPKTKALMNK